MDASILSEKGICLQQALRMKKDERWRSERYFAAL